MSRVTVIGSGSWGTTLAVLAAQNGHAVQLWSRDAAFADELARSRENVRFVPGLPFPPTLNVTHDLARALKNCALVLMVVPAQTMRENIRRARGFIPRDAIVLSCSKGLEIGSGARMSQVIAEELPREFSARIAVLSGPNLFREIADGLPAASVIAGANYDAALTVQEMLYTPTFRLYTSDDVIGVELAGALKNIVAIAAGAADGFGFGENTRATIMTRGLAEIARLGAAMGAQPLTFSGLAGIGDIVATCASPHSRNHYVGEQLARGKTRAEILAGMKMIAEGVPTSHAAVQLAARANVELPFAEQVYAVLYEYKDPRQAMLDLMAREPKREAS